MILPVFLGNTAQRLCGSCVGRFFVRLYKFDAVILAYFLGAASAKENLCKMTENMQANVVQSRNTMLQGERQSAARTPRNRAFALVGRSLCGVAFTFD